VPAAAEQVVFASHGSLALPWPGFRRFLDAVAASGDIVDDPLFRIPRFGEEARPGPDGIEG